MPATSPAALARRRERRAIRQAERRADPAFRSAENAARRKGTPRPPPKPKWKRTLDAPFVGCDGEGTTDPVTGEHRYSLFRMGDRELYADGRRLETPELLQFIIDHPSPQDYLVGFFFEYDINCILRGVQRERDPREPASPSRLERLLATDIANWQGSVEPYKGAFWTWLNFDGYPTFGVRWIGRNFLKVCIAAVGVDRRYRAIPSSIRTIEDVGHNFQCSFVQALTNWSVGDAATLAEITSQKAQRESFETITPAIRRYNALECTLLADLMEKFRAAAVAGDLVPRTWNGAGKLGAALLTMHDVMKRRDYEAACPPGFRQMARDAYYGGRFETTRAGFINQPIHALDIKSAFPAASRKLPCLQHGRFQRVSAATLQSLPRSSLYVAPVEFAHPSSSFLCGLPVRSRKGPISWPREGAGIYWSVEINSARKLGCKPTFVGTGYVYERRCRCKPFAWVENVYKLRASLDAAEKGRGTPVKLGANAFYGKLAQRVGSRTWANHCWAGLITSLVRAQLNDAIASAGPENVVMLATDALFTVNRPPAVELGQQLGQWDATSYPGMFIVQPGLYWPIGGKARRLKTRGVSIKFLEPLVPRFEDAWADFAESLMTFGRHRPPPVVKVPIRSFISLRLAYRLNDAPSGATWVNIVRKINFAWATKRQFRRMSDDGQTAILGPLPGDRSWWSYGYDEQGKRHQITMYDDGTIAGDLMASDLKDLVDAMPDYVDMGPPFTD